MVEDIYTYTTYNHQRARFQMHKEPLQNNKKTNN